jgi:hypothetical protein
MGMVASTTGWIIAGAVQPAGHYHVQWHIMMMPTGIYSLNFSVRSRFLTVPKMTLEAGFF